MGEMLFLVSFFVLFFLGNRAERNPILSFLLMGLLFVAAPSFFGAIGLSLWLTFKRCPRCRSFMFTQLPFGPLSSRCRNCGLSLKED